MRNTGWSNDEILFMLEGHLSDVDTGAMGLFLDWIHLFDLRWKLVRYVLFLVLAFPTAVVSGILILTVISGTLPA